MSSLEAKVRKAVIASCALGRYALPLGTSVQGDGIVQEDCIRWSGGLRNEPRTE